MLALSAGSYALARKGGDCLQKRLDGAEISPDNVSGRVHLRLVDSQVESFAGSENRYAPNSTAQMPVPTQISERTANTEESP